MCALISINDFSVLKTVLTFYDLKQLVRTVEASTVTSVDDWMMFIADAYRMQKAAKTIVNCFRVRRRLILARCIYREPTIYSPTLVFIIARHGGL